MSSKQTCSEYTLHLEQKMSTLNRITCILIIIISEFISGTESNCKNDPLLCGICSVCRKNNNSTDDYYCDTSYTKSDFNEDPPVCTYVDKCEQTECLNGGTCISEMNQYNCHCSDQFYGYKCQYVVDWKKGGKAFLYKFIWFLNIRNAYNQ